MRPLLQEKHGHVGESPDKGSMFLLKELQLFFKTYTKTTSMGNS